MTAEPRVACTAGADGRIVFTLLRPAAEGRQLLLRLRPKKKGGPERAVHTLDLEPDGDGRVRAVLGERPVLEEGRWDVYLLDGSDRQRLRPGPRDLRALVDGHLRDRTAPLAVRVSYATTSGHLAVRAWLRRTHAEAGGIETADGSLTVSARLHGASLTEGAAVRLRLRGGGAVQTLAPRAAADGRSFSFTADCARLAAVTPAATGVWDVFLLPTGDPDAPAVRVARLLDDVADRKRVFVYPPVTTGDAVLRPYYTVDNDLSLKVEPAGTTSG
jgi:hypothetical protein